MAHLTARYTVTRLPNRLKQIRFAGVPGHLVMDLGMDLFQVVQEGEAYLYPDMFGRGADTMRLLMFEDKPGIFNGTEPVTIDTRQKGIFDYCRLAQVEVRQLSPATISYRYLWHQMQPGHSFPWEPN